MFPPSDSGQERKFPQSRRPDVPKTEFRRVLARSWKSDSFLLSMPVFMARNSSDDSTFRRTTNPSVSNRYRSVGESVMEKIFPHEIACSMSCSYSKEDHSYAL